MSDTIAAIDGEAAAAAAPHGTHASTPKTPPTEYPPYWLAKRLSQFPKQVRDAFAARRGYPGRPSDTSPIAIAICEYTHRDCRVGFRENASTPADPAWLCNDVLNSSVDYWRHRTRDTGTAARAHRMLTCKPTTASGRRARAQPRKASCVRLFPGVLRWFRGRTPSCAAPAHDVCVAPGTARYCNRHFASMERESGSGICRELKKRYCSLRWDQV